MKIVNVKVSAEVSKQSQPYSPWPQCVTLSSDQVPSLEELDYKVGDEITFLCIATLKGITGDEKKKAYTIELTDVGIVNEEEMGVISDELVEAVKGELLEGGPGSSGTKGPGTRGGKKGYDKETLIHQTKLSSEEYSKIRNSPEAKNYEWDADEGLYHKVLSPGEDMDRALEKVINVGKEQKIFDSKRRAYDALEKIGNSGEGEWDKFVKRMGKKGVLIEYAPQGNVYKVRKSEVVKAFNESLIDKVKGGLNGDKNFN